MFDMFDQSISEDWWRDGLSMARAQAENQSMLVALAST